MVPSKSPGAAGQNYSCHSAQARSMLREYIYQSLQERGQGIQRVYNLCGHAFPKERERGEFFGEFLIGTSKEMAAAAPTTPTPDTREPRRDSNENRLDVGT